MKDIPLSPQVWAALDYSRQLAELGQPIDNPLESAREFYNRMAVMAGDPEAVFQVEDQLIEHPFPAGVNDAYNVLRWVAGHGESIGVDPGRIAVAGDSAGGNIAAVTARRARKSGMSEVHSRCCFIL